MYPLWGDVMKVPYQTRYTDGTYVYSFYDKWVVKHKDKYDKNYPYYHKKYESVKKKLNINGIPEIVSNIHKDLYKNFVCIHQDIMIIDMNFFVIRKQLNMYTDYYIHIFDFFLNLIQKFNTVKYSLTDYFVLYVDEYELVNRVEIENYEVKRYFDVFGKNVYTKKVLVKNPNLDEVVSFNNGKIITNGITEYLGKEYKAYINDTTMMVRKNGCDIIFIIQSTTPPYRG